MRTTFASGLRVPKPYGDALILDIVRQSGGLVLDFDDQQILASLLDWARQEGVLLSPGGSSGHGGLRSSACRRVAIA